MKGIHVRYLGEALRAVDGVGVFAKGTVAFAPREVAIVLLASGEFEAVTKGPTAQVFVVRIGQDTIPTPDNAAPPRREGPDELADFERELEEEEARLTAAGAESDPESDPESESDPGAGSGSRSGAGSGSRSGAGSGS